MMKSSEFTQFEDISLGCHCFSPENDDCYCMRTEKILRWYASEFREFEMRPMTDQEKEWCVKEAVYAGEGSYRAEDFDGADDRYYARHVLSAWNMYVKSNCLP